MTFALAVMMCRSLPTNACQAARHGGESAVAFVAEETLLDGPSWNPRDDRAKEFALASFVCTSEESAGAFIAAAATESVQISTTKMPRHCVSNNTA